MNFNLVDNIEHCLVLIRDSYPLGMIYYSHITSTIIALLVGSFVFLKNRKSSENIILFMLSLIFSVWVVFNLFIWTGYNSKIIMFLWSLSGILIGLLFILSLYLTYAFFYKKDVSLSKKIIWGILLLPIILLTPTDYNLIGFSIVDDCEAMENEYFSTYYYMLGLLVFLWILVLAVFRYKKAEGNFKKQVLLFSLGIEFFILSFFVSGYIASLTGYYELEFYGIFSMAVFMGFLSYLIVQYKAFDIKVLAAQALVIALVILIGSQFFFIRNNTNRILTGITLVLATGFGYVLIRSIKLEIKRKEELQVITEKLAKANDRLRELDNAKSEFVSIASHQLRTPLTSIKGFISLLMEGSYGELKKEHRDILTKVYTSNERLIHLVEDLLNLSRIESGRMEYNFEKIQLGEVCQEIYDTFTLKAKDKKLFLKLKIAKDDLPAVTTDRAKIVEVISNLVDNALKYTPKGGVEVRVEKSKENNSYVRVCVKDTGIGVPKEEIPYLFAKFSRGRDTSRLNAAGTGLGLHVGRKMIEALQGRILVESEGEGKGSTFIVEVPVERAG